MLYSLLHLTIDPFLNLAYFAIRLLMIALPIVTALFVFSFFADIFYYFMINSGF